MNAVGAYDDIDMRGIEPSLYEPVPRHVQDALRHFEEDLRIVKRNETGRHAVLVRARGTVTHFDDVHLRGWAVLIWDWQHPLGDGSGIAANVRGLIRRLEYHSDEECEKDVERRIADYEAEQSAQQDRDLADFVDDMFPRGLLQDRALQRDVDAADMRDADLGHRARKANERGRLLIPHDDGSWREVKV